MINFWRHGTMETASSPKLLDSGGVRRYAE